MLALLYAVAVILAALWAWYTDVTLLHVAREHMLPDILLLIVSLPTSHTIDLLSDRWPALFQTPFVGLAWLTACGAFQAAVLYLLSMLVPKPRSAA